MKYNLLCGAPHENKMISLPSIILYTPLKLVHLCQTCDTDIPFLFFFFALQVTQSHTPMHKTHALTS